MTALIVLALTQPVTVGVVLWFLNKRDERESKERQIWANRIQAPETAVVQTLVDEADLTPDTEATELTEYERLMGTFTDA